MKRIVCTAAVAAAFPLLCSSSVVRADALVSKDAAGRVRVVPYPVSSSFHNAPWSTAAQDEFAMRCTAIIDSIGSSTSYGSPYFESEKSMFPKAMLSYVWGIANNNATSKTAAKKALTDNATADKGLVGGSENTDLVDLFPSFTIKAQVAKYFYFGKHSANVLGTTAGYLHKQYAATATGDDLAWASKTYLERFRSAATKWTLDSWVQPTVSSNTGGYTVANNGVAFPDPFYRPNRYWVRPLNAGEENWKVEARNSWVDIRSTDNLKAMREVGAFLFAHETGNVNVRDLYAARYQVGAVNLARTGVSEWDSSNYAPWSIAPHLSMFDYASETLAAGKTKKQAKAQLDFLFAAGALKYWRGGYIAPTARDYGGTTVANGNESAKFLSLYFGQTYAAGALTTAPAAPKWETPVHAILSGYRPSRAIVGLATRSFTRGVEVLGTKPTYGNFEGPEIAKPRYFETMYYGDNFHLGTVVSPDSASDHHSKVWNIGTLRLGTTNARRGLDGFAANTSTVNARGEKQLGDQVAQYRQLAVWLRPADGKTFFFMAPDPTRTAINGGTGAMSVASGIYYFQYEKAWVALRPINITYNSAVTANGTAVNIDEKIYQFTSSNTSGSYAGFAIEVGEQGTGAGQFASFSAFQTAVQAKTLDLSQLSSGVARLNGTDGSFVKIAHNASNDLPGLYRNSTTAFDFASADNYALYRSINQAPTSSVTGLSDGGTVAVATPISVSMAAADTGNRGPVAAGWKTGQLTVVAGGQYFEQNVTPTGDVTWSDRAAVAADYLGAVKAVELYANGQLVGRDTNGTDGWQVSWTPGSVGAQIVRARAIDNDEQVGWSTPVTVTAQ